MSKKYSRAQSRENLRYLRDRFCFESVDKKSTEKPKNPLILVLCITAFAFAIYRLFT